MLLVNLRVAHAGFLFVELCTIFFMLVKLGWVYLLPFCFKRTDYTTIRYRYTSYLLHNHSLSVLIWLKDFLDNMDAIN